MAKDFLYLVAVLDWHARFVLSRELRNTLDVRFYFTARHAAVAWQSAPF